MNIRTLFAAIAVAALIPGTVLAKDGPFIAASIGHAGLSEQLDGFDVDSDSTAFRVAFGWRFNDYLAIDAGYHNFGRFEQSFDIGGRPAEVSLKADGFTVGGLGSLPVSERISLFARAGAYFWDGDAEINDATAATPEDSNFYFGAGASLGLTDRLSATVDGSRYDLDGTTSTVYSIGFDYGF